MILQHDIYFVLDGQAKTTKSGVEEKDAVDLVKRLASSGEAFEVFHIAMCLQTRLPEASDIVTEDFIRNIMAGYDMDDLPVFWSGVDPDYYHELTTRQPELLGAA